MKRRRRRKWKEPSSKARERLHAMRMKFKAGYAEKYLKSLGFNEREIDKIIKRDETGDLRHTVKW